MPTKKRELRYVPARELRAIINADGSRTLSGYAAVFNTLSVDMGGWQETIAPGAFTRSLKSNPDVVLLRDHDPAILFGRTRSKTLTLDQDNTGLKFECTLPATTQAADLIALLDRGDLDGCSFSFVTNMDDWKTTPDGVTIRTLIDVDLHDVSVVSEPAYPDTSVSLRSAPKEVRSAIESRKKSKRDDDGDTEEDSKPAADCECTCDSCVDGDCDGCDTDDCDCDSCDCDASSESHRNRAHMTLTLANLRAK